jgi:probable addiction module antidote protein
MALETISWDSAEFLETPEDVAAYLEAAFEDGDTSVIKHALAAVARAKGVAGIASDSGLSMNTLGEALTPDGDKLATFLSVLHALGLKMPARAA